jgi:hypothetical protein
MAGQLASLQFAEAAKGWKMEEVSALGDSLHQATAIHFQPFETKFVRIWK